MSLKMKHEDENDIFNNENVVPLDNEQIKSILKTALPCRAGHC